MAEKKKYRNKGMKDTDDTLKYGPAYRKLSNIEYQSKKKMINDYLEERDKLSPEKRAYDSGAFMSWLTGLKKKVR